MNERVYFLILPISYRNSRGVLGEIYLAEMLVSRTPDFTSMPLSPKPQLMFLYTDENARNVHH